MQTIREIAQNVVRMEDVQPGYPNWQRIQELKKKNIKPASGMMKGVTWCNRFVDRVATLAGYDTYPMLDDKYHHIGYTNANTCYNQLCKAVENGTIPVDVTAAVAQSLANMNILVIMAAPGRYHGHVAIVINDRVPYDEKLGVKIIQAGGLNGEFYANKIFIAPFIYPERIRYFLLNRIKSLKE